MPGTQRDIPYLEDKFQTGDVPTQQDFYDLFASFLHYLEVKQVVGASTTDVMSQKAINDFFKKIANDPPTLVNTSGTLTINGVVGSLLTLNCSNKEESKFKFVGDTSPLSIDITNFPEGAYAMLTIERSTNVNISIRFKDKTYLLSNTQLINNGKDALIVRGRGTGRTLAYLGFYRAAETGAQNNEAVPVVTNVINLTKFTEDTQL